MEKKGGNLRVSLVYVCGLINNNSALHSAPTLIESGGQSSVKKTE